MNAEEQVIRLQPQMEEENMDLSSGEKILVFSIIGFILCAIEFFLLLW